MDNLHFDTNAMTNMAHARVAEIVKNAEEFHNATKRAPLDTLEEIKLLRLTIEAAVVAFGTPEQVAQFEKYLEERTSQL